MGSAGTSGGQPASAGKQAVQHIVCGARTRGVLVCKNGLIFAELHNVVARFLQMVGNQ
jgi:hypothetical protein